MSIHKESLIKRYKFLKGVFYCIPLFLFSNLHAQELKPSFTLDTAKTQVFPFDLEFNLKLISPKSKPFKAIYLYRLNRNGDIVIDDNTSLKHYSKTTFYNLDAIKKKILIDSTVAKNYLSTNKNSKPIWDEKLKLLNKKKVDIEVELKLESEALNHQSKIDELKRVLKQIQTLKFKIDKYETSDSLITYQLSNRERLIKQFKKAPAILPLEVISREADTLIVRIEPLRPNKRYLIAALEYSDKLTVLAKLVKEYQEYEEFGEYYLSLIPPNYSAAKDESFYSEQISPTLLKSISEMVKGPLQEYNTPPNLDSFKPKKPFPGPYSYPTDLIQNNSINDSLYSLPDGASLDFRELNAILVSLKNYGDDLIKGKSKIQLDENNRLNMSFKPSTDLAEQNTNINHNLKLTNKAKQSLYLLEQSDSIMSVYEGYLNDFAKTLEKNKKSITGKLEKNKKIKKNVELNYPPIGLNFTTLEKTTNSYQFLTRNSRLIKPDFGLLYYYSGEGFQGFAPFAGFHFGIRSRNEDIPFGQIPGWEKYLSFQVGVPFYTGSLLEEGRRKHLVGDSFSLYGGVGVNINHAIRITYGGILFRGIDSNSAGEGTFKIKTVQAVSVSINLKLKSLFEGLYGSINSVNPTKS